MRRSVICVKSLKHIKNNRKSQQKGHLIIYSDFISLSYNPIKINSMWLALIVNQ